MDNPSKNRDADVEKSESPSELLKKDIVPIVKDIILKIEKVLSTSGEQKNINIQDFVEISNALSEITNLAGSRRAEWQDFDFEMKNFVHDIGNRESSLRVSIICYKRYKDDTDFDEQEFINDNVSLEELPNVMNIINFFAEYLGIDYVKKDLGAGDLKVFLKNDFKRWDKEAKKRGKSFKFKSGLQDLDLLKFDRKTMHLITNLIKNCCKAVVLSDKKDCEVEFNTFAVGQNKEIMIFSLKDNGEGFNLNDILYAVAEEYRRNPAILEMLPERAQKAISEWQNNSFALNSMLLEDVFQMAHAPNITGFLKKDSDIFSSGAGLAIVKEAISDKKGMILTGNRESGGAEFAIILPSKNMPKGEIIKIEELAKRVRKEGLEQVMEDIAA